MRFGCLLLAASVASTLPAQSHGTFAPVPLPAHHAVALAGKFAPKVFPKFTPKFMFARGSTAAFTPKQFVSLLSKQNAGFFLPSLGSSISQRAFQQQTNAIVQNAFNLGTTRVLEAQITNGTLTGTFYVNTTGNTYQQLAGTTQPTFAVGNNPFNVRGDTNGTFTFPPTNNFLTLKPIMFRSSGDPPSGPIPAGMPLHSSLATQAILGRFNALNEGGYAAGVKAGSGPITSGQLSGTFYDQIAGGSYLPVNKFVFAFGNNPLNVISSTGRIIQINNLTSFADFGKLNRVFSSGELFTTVYVPNLREGVLLAIGKDALNNFPASVSFVPTNFTSFVFF